MMKIDGVGLLQGALLPAWLNSTFVLSGMRLCKRGRKYSKKELGTAENFSDGNQLHAVFRHLAVSSALRFLCKFVKCTAWLLNFSLY